MHDRMKNYVYVIVEVADQKVMPKGRRRNVLAHSRTTSDLIGVEEQVKAEND